MTKAQAIQLMIKGKKLVSTDVGFHYFYIQYKNDKFVDSLGNEVNINVLNGVWSIYEPNLVDKFINKLWGIWVFNRRYFAYEIENMEKELIADTKHYVLFGGIVLLAIILMSVVVLYD